MCAYRLHKHSPRIVLVVLLLLAITCSIRADEIGALKPAAATPSGAEYNNGLSALAAGDLTEAKLHFNKSLQLDPSNKWAYLGLAKVAVAKGDPKDAMEPLRKAAALAPADASLQTTWGHYLLLQKEYPEAEAVLKKAAQLDPKATRPRMELGNLYSAGLHQPKLAIESYRAAVATDPHNVGAHFALAEVLADTGQFDQAQSQLEEASRLDPQNPAIFQAIGDLQLRRNDRDGALQSYAQALNVQPNFIPARIARGDVFLAKGETGKALDEYRGALNVDAKFAPAYVKIGGTLERQHLPDDARQAYKTAISLDPMLAVAYNNLAWMAVQAKTDPGEALAWAQKAVELAPTVGNFQDTLGWVYCSRGQYDEAIVALKKAAALAPGEPEVFYHLGVAYSQKKQFKEAQDAFSRSLALKKDFAEANDARSRLASLSAMKTSRQ